MTRQLFLVAAGVVFSSGLFMGSTAWAAVSQRHDVKKTVRQLMAEPQSFGKNRTLGAKRRVRMHDTTAVLVPKGPFQGRATVGQIPDTVTR